VDRAHAPLARWLPHRRAAGEDPAHGSGTDTIRNRGWTANLGSRGLGDIILGLGLVVALADAAVDGGELYYRGPRPRLMQRCRLPLDLSIADGPHVVGSRSAGGLSFTAVAEEPPAWLDLLDDDRVEVHAALPMRHYLTVEQTLGIRLPADRAPLPTFVSHARAQPFHVVFIGATSWLDRKDYGADGFAAITRHLLHRLNAPWTFTLITGPDGRPATLADVDVLVGIDAVDCLDVFASAEMIIGNDTGLTHLAALTQRPDGTSPQVIGLYGRHAHTKWTTGRDGHHAIATSFSQMLAAADRCPVRDQLDDALWAKSMSLTDIPAEFIADFAAQLAGWW
jgi:hypothetical protein